MNPQKRQMKSVWGCFCFSLVFSLIILERPGAFAMVIINQPSSSSATTETTNTQGQQQQNAQNPSGLIPVLPQLNQQLGGRVPGPAGLVEFPAPADNLTPSSRVGLSQGRYPTRLSFPEGDPQQMNNSPSSPSASSNVGGRPLPPQGAYPTRLVFNHW